MHFDATFPGIAQVLSCSYTLSHGITPGIFQLECLLNLSAAHGPGTLTFIDHDNPAFLIEFPDCRVDAHKIVRTSRGRSWIVPIFDRRWRWQFGDISGHYNLVMDNGIVDPAHEKTPQELASLCLDAMFETNYDVTELPNEERPEVDWDYENPAKALQSLCELAGCRVVLRLDNTVKICRIGVGNPLPLNVGTSGPMEDSGALDFPIAPDAIICVTRKRFQQDFELEAVGEDTDGSIKPIEDLSYMPTGGWEDTSPPDFWDVVGDAERELAKKTVYRWYRIKNTDDDGNPIVLEGAGYTIEELSQILPTYSEQCATYTDPDTNVVKNEPPLVFGVFYDGTLAFDNVAPDTDYQRDFTLNTEKGIVEFADYVYKFRVAAGSIAYDSFVKADLKLRVAVGLRDQTQWNWLRYERLRAIPTDSFSGLTRILMHEEISLDYINGVVQNQVEVDAEADYYLDGAEQEYQITLPQEVTLPGLVRIDPDGAIQQIEWRVGAQGATTTASRNTEFSVVVPPYPLRRVNEFLRAGGMQNLAGTVERTRKGDVRGRARPITSP